MKVYCKNCKYVKSYLDVDYPSGWHEHRHKCQKKIGVKRKTIPPKDTPVERIPRKMIETAIYCDCDKHNKDNNCEYYEKRKWWQG